MSGLRPFALHRPDTLDEAIDLLEQHGDEAMIYAGGTELLILLKAGLVRPRRLVDVKRLPRLREVAEAGDDLVIGATVAHRDVERSAAVRRRCPLVAEVARHVANVRVRNVGTVGGNLAFADPHSDLATLFLIFDATVELRGRSGARALALGDFIQGPYETARADGQILTAVRLHAWPAGTAGAYVKYGVYERPTLGVAAALFPAASGRPAELRLAAGCIGPRPQRLGRTEAAARGLDPRTIGERADELAALAAVEVDPMSDLHGSAEYKREMTRVFVRRALAVAAGRAQGAEAHARYAHTVVV